MIKLQRLPTPEDVTQLAATMICDAVRAKPDIAIGLATGRTQEPLFAELLRRYRAGRVSFGQAEDAVAEAERYEAVIHRARGIDLQILGMGTNAHIAFNEPGSPHEARTRLITLTKETWEASRGFFPAGAKVPSQALTMGIATILDCKSVLMLVTGRSKIPAMRDTLEGPIDAACPASALRRHRDCIMLADVDATAGLSNSGERYS